MSLLINDTDMPKSCMECICLEAFDDEIYGRQFFCNLLGIDALAKEHSRHKNCPLSEIPTPHGRLIDADAHIQSLKENQCGERCRKNHDCVNCGIGMYIRIVENEPTIIETEE